MMEPVSPQTGVPEVVFAKDQPQYVPLPAAKYWDRQNRSPIALTRWTFTDEERQRIAAGEDLYLGVLTFGQPLQPLMLQVGPEGWVGGFEGDEIVPMPPPPVIADV